MLKKLDISFAYAEKKDGDFRPILTKYDKVNHSILAFCIANIIFEETQKSDCFAKHVNEYLTEMVEEGNSNGDN